MNNDYLIVIVLALVAGIYACSLIQSATNRSSAALVGGGIVFLACCLACKLAFGS
jgi:F0F1-type ATP synthase assembly protein I